MFARHLADEIRRDRRIIRERLVEAPDNRFYDARQLGMDLVFGMMCSVARGHLPRILSFVLEKPCIPGESDCESVYWIGTRARHGRDDGTGVDAAAQEGAKWHFAHHSSLHRVVKLGLEL